ncbi:MAG: Tex family protein [Chloroflexi bacterium]|nr:Tex family protein [Chloroflexota bacterium]MDA1228055.1 Tex family protein [Chloroflexota bacterium]
MNERIAQIASELGLPSRNIESAANLLDGGATVPFIARYRKEATGSMDEVAILNVKERLSQIRQLDDRRETMLTSLEERGLLTEKLGQTLRDARTLTELEDLYLPHRPKRRTRATQAIEKGLEPLAQVLWAQSNIDPEHEAEAYVDDDKGVLDAESALAGARDIMAQWVSEDAVARGHIRSLYARQALLRSRVVKGKEDEAQKYRDYFEAEELLASAPSHRVLAIFRGESEGMLTARIQPSEERAVAMLEEHFLRARNAAAEQVRSSIQDGYKRLLGPSIETEARNASKVRADKAAIDVFAANLRELLLAAPIGEKTVLALDPGFRTGAKLVCLDSHGELLHNDTIFVLTGENQARQAATTVRDLVKRFGIEAIAVGNGTGGRETEAFLRSLELGPGVPIVSVNESGASVYSASAVAREEFPDQDITVRGAISIGRRLQDPLAELVKIDPQSVGVGQYQHDVDAALLQQKLDDVVMSCVNAVGVDVNTASRRILTYVSGIGPRLAENVLTYRRENGPFKSRVGLKKVSGLGPKAFEQAAGFLRIHGKNPLDASAVHPERYSVVEKIAADLNASVPQLIADPSVRSKIDLRRYADDKVGLPTLQDIMAELERPGRDPRRQFEAFRFAEGITSMDDLEQAMVLPGIITNVTDFGAFVDIGVHQDGLVHISKLADSFVRKPTDVVKVGQTVTVAVMEVDKARRRISLSMKKDDLLV